MVPKNVAAKRTRAIETAGFLFDEELTRKALKLAGATITTRAEAADCFREVAAGRPEPFQLYGTDGSVPGVLVGLPGASFDSSDWQGAQKWLRKWLPKIADAEHLPESSASAMARELSQQLAGGMNYPLQVAGMHTTLRVGRRNGHFVLTSYTVKDSIAAAAVRAVIPFLLPFGWTRRLGRCQLRTCGEWFLRPNKPGPLKQYCSKKHAVLVRVRKFRQGQL